jgi:hypothetical protein
MSSTKTTTILRSFIIVPMLATSMSLTAFTEKVDSYIITSFAEEKAGEALSQEEITLQKEREVKAAKIDAYYAKHNLPLEGYGMEMVLAAETHNLDWRLLPALAMRETTGGKFACKFNPFGWGSCKIGFESFSEAITSVAAHLGGNNPRTARYYKGKDVRGILTTYNPPSVVPTYADEVISIMKKIESITIS